MTKECLKYKFVYCWIWKGKGKKEKEKVIFERRSIFLLTDYSHKNVMRRLKVDERIDTNVANNANKMRFLIFIFVLRRKKSIQVILWSNYLYLLTRQCRCVRSLFPMNKRIKKQCKRIFVFLFEKNIFIKKEKTEKSQLISSFLHPHDIAKWVPQRNPRWYHTLPSSRSFLSHPF